MTHTTGQQNLPRIDVFVSYRRKASGTLAFTFEKEMQRRGIANVFVDTRVTDGAGPFPDRLLQAIEQCRVFVCLVGDGTFDSQWVRREIEHACRLGKPMIPVFQESYVPTPTLPSEAIAALLQYDGVKILDQTNLYMDEAFERLANMLRKTLRRTPNRTPLFLGIGVVIVATLIALGVAVRVFSPLMVTNIGTALANQPTETLTSAATLTPTITPSDVPTTILLTGTPSSVPATLTALPTDEPIDTLIARQRTIIALSWTPTNTLTQTNTFTPTASFTPTLSNVQLSNMTLTAGAWTKTFTATPTPTSTWTPITIFTTPLPPGFTRRDSVDPDLTLVWVPPGSFTMGSTDQQITDAYTQAKKFYATASRDFYERELPAHEVTITRGYWLDQMLVTNAAYQKFVDTGGYAADAYWSADGLKWRNDNKITGPDMSCTQYSSEPTQPRVCVSYYEAEAYAAWRGGRLPTEAEWEYAARGPDSLIFPWGDDYDTNGTHLNFCDKNCEYIWADKSINDGYPYTSPVGNYPAGKSWINAYDMAGNGWQWVSDLYGDYPNMAQTDPTGSSNGSSHVLRGGAWDNDASLTRCSVRLVGSPGSRLRGIDFRVVGISPPTSP